MERLTQKDEQGNWILKAVPWESLHEGKVITKELWERLYGALWKLMEYEDTGLSPEEVEGNMTKQLKPCPFCGGEAVVKINRGFNRTIFDVFVYCEKCGASTCTYVLKETAIKAWNQRADEDTGLTPNKVEQLKEDRRWLPVEDRLPKDDNYILLSFENFDIPLIGRYKADADGGGSVLFRR